MIARSAGDPVAGEPAPGTSPLPLAARLPAGCPLGALERIAAGPVHPAVLELPAVRSTDDGVREFFTEAGWAPDSAHRELDLHGDGTVTVKQIRLHSTIA